MNVRPKKHLGQHFLHDENIAGKIVRQISDGTENILEIGPGTGVLTKYLLENKFSVMKFIDTDQESIEFLKETYPGHSDGFIHGDFLKMELGDYFRGKITIIGNLPYNISSQIFFKILENRHRVSEVVCMIQKEVAERIASGPGTKTYGILSVLLKAFYDVKILFTVSEHVFIPPPKVKSAVVKMTRNNVTNLDCDEEVFTRVVKKAFNQRRKALRNSLKSFVFKDKQDQTLAEMLSRRPEQMSVNDFINLARNVITEI